MAGAPNRSLAAGAAQRGEADLLAAARQRDEAAIRKQIRRNNQRLATGFSSLFPFDGAGGARLADRVVAALGARLKGKPAPGGHPGTGLHGISKVSRVNPRRPPNTGLC